MPIFQQPTSVPLAMVTALSSAYHSQETVASVTVRQGSSLIEQQRRNVKVSFYCYVSIWRFPARRRRE